MSGVRGGVGEKVGELMREIVQGPGGHHQDFSFYSIWDGKPLRAVKNESVQKHESHCIRLNHVERLSLFQRRSMFKVTERG